MTDRLERVSEARRQMRSARLAFLLAIVEARAAGATLQQVGDAAGNVSRQQVRLWVQQAERLLTSNGGN